MKADFVFVIDSTGSMSSAINGVKSNISAFAEELESRGIDVRFALIDFRDVLIGETTRVHRFDGSYEWTESAEELENALASISVDGGGDYPETPTEAIMKLFDSKVFGTYHVDATGKITRSGPFRSDASRFVFLMTDAPAKEGKSYSGLPTLSEVAGRLRGSKVHTVVVSDESLRAYYKSLWDAYYGGMFLNIYGDYYENMLEVAGLVYDATGLTIKAFERGRATDDTSTLNPPSYNTIRYIEDGKYITHTGEAIREINIANLGDEYRKDGYTADGNTRLIIRVQNDKAGIVTIGVPEGYGTLETIDGETLGSAATKPTESFGNMHQASFVLVAPESYPYKKEWLGLSDNYPKDNFDVEMVYNSAGGVERKNLKLSINAAPVVMVHGLTSDYAGAFNIGRDFAYTTSGIIVTRNKPGIYNVLANDNGLNVSGYDYGGYEGPTWHIIEKNSGYKNLNTSGMFRAISAAMKTMLDNRIACTRVDLVCHSMGGLMAQAFLEYEDGRSERSYKQSMIRRVVSVATPYEGSPWPSCFLGRAEDLPYIKKFREKYPSIGEELTTITDEDYKAYAAIRVLTSEYFWPFVDSLGMIGYAPESWKDLALGSKLVNDLHRKSPRPLYVIYGKISNAMRSSVLPVIYKVIGDIARPIARSKISELEKLPPDSTGAKQLAFWGDLDYILSDYERFEALFKVLFNEEDYDLAVGESSARSIFAESSMKSFEVGSEWYDRKIEGAWHYWHSGLCHQDNVGELVLDLLKAGDEEFDKSGVGLTRTSSSAPKRTRTSAPARNYAGLNEDKTIKALTLTAKALGATYTAPASFTLSEQTDVLLRVSRDSALSVDLFIRYHFTGDNSSGIARLVSADDDGVPYITLTIESTDVGIFELSAFAPGSGDNVYISDTINLAVRPDLASYGDRVTGLYFLNGDRITITSQDSEVGVALFAETDKGQMFNVSSPLMGTVWTAEDASIAKITDRGWVKSLKQGSTILTAVYGGFSASVAVDVAVQADVSAPEALSSSDLYILNASLPEGRVGEMYYCFLDTTLSATNSIDWTVAGLPDTISCDSDGMIYGKPTESGDYTITITASDGEYTDTKTFTLLINASGATGSPIITTTNLPSGKVGENYSFTLEAAGDAPITWRMYSGLLPAGLALSDSGTLSGMPEVSGDFALTISATNLAGSDRQYFSLHIDDGELITSPDEPVIVDEAPTITTSRLPDGTRGSSYSFTFRASGTRPITWSIDGAPSGLSLEGSTLSGTPSIIGSFRLTVTATNSAGHDTKEFTLTISAPVQPDPKPQEDPTPNEPDPEDPDLIAPTIMTSLLPTGTAGQAYSFTITVSGTQPVTLTLKDGTLPEGLSFRGGTISGTPVESGVFTLTIEAANSEGTDTKTLALNINAAPEQPKPEPPAQSEDVTPEPPDNTEPETEPSIRTGAPRGISSLSYAEVLAVSNDSSMIAAVLPLATVNVSGKYRFRNVALNDNVPAGSVLVWNSFIRSGNANDASDAEFFDSRGIVTKTVPEDHVIDVSASLFAGRTYAPVISAMVSRHEETHESSDGGGGGGCNISMTGIILLIFSWITLTCYILIASTNHQSK